MDIGYVVSSPAAWIALITIAIYSIYRRGTRNFDYFSSQGIPGPKPIPFVGNLWGLWKKNMIENDMKMVKEFGKVFGTFDGTVPNLWVHDTELIKSIFIKDFDHFINRRPSYLEDKKVFRKMLGVVEDSTEWKEIRSVVSPSFTSGNIKRYSVQMKECADKLCTNLKSLASDQGKMILREELNKVSMDIIAKCSFGLNIPDLNAKDNLFMEKASQVFVAPENQSPSVLIPFLFPTFLIKWLSKGLFQNDSFQYFVDLMTDLVAQRSKSTQTFHDFPEIMTESISSYSRGDNGMKETRWNKKEIEEIVIAQSAVFLLAGFDTTSHVLSSCLYKMAQHPEMQEKLYEDISSKIEQYGEVCHEMVQDVPYLEQFISEVLRMLSPGVRLERVCNKDVSYNGIHIKKGMTVSVSLYALHYSEEFFPDPKTFNPDRWSPENKANINPYAYMPFGQGPRNCVAMRFAREELKMVLCTLIQQFRFFPVEETPVTINAVDGFLLLAVREEIPLGLVSRV